MPFLRFGHLVSVAAVLLFASSHARAQNGVLGTWTEPTGSSIAIEHCASGICLRLVSISRKAPTQTDDRNPDPALRHRALCGLLIGSGFHLAGEDKAEGGTLYDPKSGKTYKGAMTRVGNELHLRGYVGLKLFGATETWVASSHPADCKIKLSFSPDVL